MKKFILSIFLCTIIWSNGFMQSICDNKFAFGFENIFNWNVVFVSKPLEDSEIRMIMFEDISTVKDRIITCEIAETEENAIEKIISSENTIVIDTITNPYGNKDTYIITKKNNNKRMNALIDHFGYLLNVSYYDNKSVDKEKFKRLIGSYINIKLQL
jgi:hypothetical protein